MSIHENGVGKNCFDGAISLKFATVKHECSLTQVENKFEIMRRDDLCPRKRA